MRDLETLRKSLDNIDTALVRLFAERFKLTHEVGLYKHDHQLPPVDEAREQEQFDRLAQQAEEAGLNPDFIRKIMRLTIDEVVENHRQIQASGDHTVS